MRSPEIRERFLNFFAGRGHHRLPSASLLTEDDPTVLFTVAGMVPLKPYFLGLRRPPAARLTSSQKSFRTLDIEEVGRTPRHQTLFEMLGNFSIGDYFKEGAITLAWELLTVEYGLDAGVLWPSVHSGDAEAFRIWTEVVGVPPERMTQLDDNFWAPGPTGPCGYDSEIYVDRNRPCSCGRDVPECRPGCEGDRFLEIWNLVFIEFDRDQSGTMTPLAMPCIDTGMGLERICSVLQGVDSTFETDLFVPLIEGFASRATALGGGDATVALRVLADHVRGTSFLIADGVVPGNEGRGYVLRRLIRRATLFGRRIGLVGGLAGGVADLVAVMGEAYPELIEHQTLVETTLEAETALFESTLTRGSQRFDALASTAGASISGADAFDLYETHGFPLELTLELARDRGMSVDVAGYEAALAEARSESQRAIRRGTVVGTLPPLAPTTVTSDDVLEITANVVHLQGLDGAVDRATAGTTVGVVIEPTCFYAEGGGQIGDAGELVWEGGRALVIDTQPTQGGEVRVCTASVVEGVLERLTAVTARVDAPRRAQTARHHSATHLLNAALRRVLGPGVSQRGSLVAPDHTTFDFTFPRALTDEEVRRVEHEVNGAIRRNLERRTEVLPIAAARSGGAVSMAGERYPEMVRVVAFGDWSKELCGGTHVVRSGDLGAAIIVAESSVGAGTRRVELVVGEAAERRWTEAGAVLRQVASTVRAGRPEEITERVVALQQQVRRLTRDLEEARRATVSSAHAATAVEEVNGVSLAHRIVDGDRDVVKAAVDTLFADRLDGGGVALVIGTSSLAVKVGRDAMTRGVRAGDLVRAASEATGGRGGGRDDFGTGGVGDPSRREAAVEAVRSAVGAAA